MKNTNKKRTDFEYNHYLISESFHKLLVANKRVPTLKAIAKDSGLHLNTVHTHLKQLSFEEVKPKFKLMTERILTTLGVNAMNKGKAPEVKLFMQLVEGFMDKTESNHTIDLEEARKQIEEIYRPKLNSQ